MPRDDARVRELSDPREIRALAHPLRLDLLELLQLEGPLTATDCARRTGESAASCSFHLRQLAKYGFVEEAEGGTGRRRPWRRVSRGHVMRADAMPSGNREAVSRLARVVRERHSDMFDAVMDRADELDPAWADAAFQADYVMYLTPDELADLAGRVREMDTPYRDRLEDPSKRPEGSRPVQLVSFGFPRPDSASPRPAHDGVPSAHAEDKETPDA